VSYEYETFVHGAHGFDGYPGETFYFAV
jgi:hypothetical protein